MEGAWQVEMKPGVFEVFEISLDNRDNNGDGTLDGVRLEYEATDFEQAGWRHLRISPDGELDMESYRGPGLTAVAFRRDMPLHTFLMRKNIRVATNSRTLRFSRFGLTAEARPHPARTLAAPAGRMWRLEDYPFADSFDPADHTVPAFNPDLSFADALEAAIARTTISFRGYTAGVRSTCNGGGATFAQTETAFVPLSGVMMTEVGCGDGGLADSVAASLIREGPPFLRDGDRLVRDFPEGRMSFTLVPFSRN